MRDTFLCRNRFGQIGLRVFVITAAAVAVASAAAPEYYVRKGTWQETMLASRQAMAKLQGAGEIGVSLPDLGGSDFTVAAWIRTDKAGGTIISKALGDGAWAIQGKVFFLRGGRPAMDVGWVGVVESETKVSDGKWHHVALAKADDLTFYVDGGKVHTGRLEIQDDPEGCVLSIGFGAKDFPEPSGFDGDIDEVRIYSRALSADEVNTVFAGAGQVKDGLAGWWRFENGAEDFSGNSNHGRIEGAKSCKGKLGKGLNFDGSSRVALPSSRAESLNNQLWQLVRRDFGSEQARQEMNWELKDGIWQDGWETDEVGAMAVRYAGACRDIGGLADKAKAAGTGVRSVEALQKVRRIYHLSRRAEQAYRVVGEKIEAMRQEIDYLAENYTRNDVRWGRYKSGVGELSEIAEKMLTDLVGGETSAVEKLVGLAGRLGEHHAKLPLKLPSGSPGPGRFGAYYKRLKYSLEWDRAWRIGPDPDVVVRFDEFGHRFVFWRGTSYIPCWVAEGGGWYTNEFFERRGGPRSGTVSMVEPMSDKQARYSHVRIIESTDARVVVHWRYAPVDLKYSLAYTDKQTGWGDWADEYYTIYPDAVGVRKATLQTSAPGDWTEYQESIVINQPGTRPEDNMHYAAVTLVNMAGESHTYSWEHTWPNQFDKPENGNIQIVNLKGRTRTFSIVDPDGVSVRAYPRYGAKTEFHCWNHWPVAQEESDTTVATTFDKPSHTSLSHITWKPYAQSAQSRTWVMLHGMTDGPAADLADLAKSWLTAAELDIKSGKDSFTSDGYDTTERAWKLTCTKSDRPSKLVFVLRAGEDSPVVNPAFVIEGWSESAATLAVDGKGIRPGKDLRFGHRADPDGSDLIVWLRLKSARPVEITLSAVQ